MGAFLALVLAIWVSYHLINHLTALLMLRLMVRYPDWSHGKVRGVATLTVCVGWLVGMFNLEFLLRLL